MDKLGLRDRILLGRAFTIAMNLVALAIVAPIIYRDMMEWLSLSTHLTARPVEGGEPLAMFLRQDAVGGVLVARGVILGDRHTYVERVMKVDRLDHLPGQEEFSEICAIFGFYVLVLGLLIECLDQAGGFFDLHHLVTLHVFYGVSAALNVAADRMEPFGARLATLRQAAGYKQIELAAELGISQRMLAYYESPRAHPPTALLPALAPALGVSVEQLLGVAVVKANSRARVHDTRLWRRFAQIEKLPPAERTPLSRCAMPFWPRPN